MIFGAMQTECHLVRFNSHPTKVYTSCRQCRCEINNTAHVCYDCPLVHYIWMVLQNTFYITLGVRININFTFGVLNFLTDIKGINKNKKHLIFTWMMIARKMISSAWSSSIHSIQLLSYYSPTLLYFPNILLKPLKSNF